MCIVDGRLPEAKESMARALSEDPSSPQALLGAMYLEMRVGNSEAALRMLKARKGDSSSSSSSGGQGIGGQNGLGGGGAAGGGALP